MSRITEENFFAKWHRKVVCFN